MIERIFSVSFCAENCLSNGLFQCEVCKIKFIKGEIRIVHSYNTRINLHYHLHCYSPKVPQFIRKSDIEIYLKEESRFVFEDWLKAWNSKYFPLDNTPIISVIPSKSLPSISLTRRRTLIEIFMFLPINDMISGVFLVCKEFYQISWDNELWQSLIFRDFQLNEFFIQAKSKYIELYNNLCIECKTIPSEYNFYRCPYLKKTICQICLGNKKFHVLNRTDILRRYEIDAKLLDLDYATSDEGKKVAYRYKIEQKIYKFREKKKTEVLGICQILGDDHYFVHSVKNINVKMMDCNYEIDLFDYTFQNSKALLNKLCVEKFFEKVEKCIKTGKGKITEAQVIKNLGKRLVKNKRIDKNR